MSLSGAVSVFIAGRRTRPGEHTFALGRPISGGRSPWVRSDGADQTPPAHPFSPARTPRRAFGRPGYPATVADTSCRDKSRPRDIYKW